MKSKTDELIEKGFHHAMNFFKSNHRGLDNQELCLKQLMELTGFNFETCLKIQNPVLSLYMAYDTMSIGQSVIENNMRMVTQNIHNHLLSLQPSQIFNEKFEISKEKPIVSDTYKNIIAKTSNPTHGYLLKDMRTIDISKLGLKDDDIGVLVKNLQYQLLNLDKFDVSYNLLGYTAVENLFYTFRLGSPTATYNIKYMNLSNNQIGDDGAKYIASHLGNGLHPNLQCLDVSGNQITTKGYGHFANALNSEMVKDIVLTLETIDFLTKGGKYYSDQLVQHFKSFQINEIRSNMSVDKWKECKETGVNVGMSGFTGIMKSALGGKFNTASMFTYAVKEILMDNLLKPETLYCYIDVKDFISEVVGEVSDQNCTIF